MRQLSIIIVNYNVKYFLEQALRSVRKALEGIDGEVFVVDNASNDGSVALVQERFPEVKLIANTKNVGFSVANNQAIRQSEGKYILLLNPDTVVEEDTFRKTLAFMEAHQEAGGLGVKMIDGKGNFLPESKRAFPSPKVAFFKAFGLSALFPRSKTFARYHLGHLPEDDINEVEVLAGAFMLLRKEVLDEIGLLDETFFMYGEDIDLSYRIVLAGYKNYYFPDTRIIHYKGESTKKGSLNYVKLFYQAMVIFAEKHASGGQAQFFSLFIHLAIYFKAFLHLISRLFRQSWPMLLDAILIYGGIYFLQDFWATQVRNSPDYYPTEYLAIIVPIYIAIWLVTIYFSGGYDRPLKISKAIRGLFFGTLIILALYGLVDEQYRFSRAIILLGAAWAVVEVVLTRLLHHFAQYKNFNLETSRVKNQLIVGYPEEGQRVLGLLKQTGVYAQYVGLVTPTPQAGKREDILGDLEELEDIVKVFEVDEVIFCAKDVPAQTIIRYITLLGNGLEYKIVPEESLSIIGSNSKNSAGDLYAIDVNLQIATPMSKRNKRVLDLLFCLLLLLLSPVMAFITPLGGLLRNVLQVLIGQKTWVGYAPIASGEGPTLPPLRTGVLYPQDGVRLRKTPGQKTLHHLNWLYAKDYSAGKDFWIIWRGRHALGRA